MTKKKKPVEVTIEYSLLDKISKYYNFPTAVFFMTTDKFKPPYKTRDEMILQKLNAFDKISDIIEKAKQR